MATGLSTFIKNKLLDYLFKGTTFAANPVYLSLHTADPGATGASEVVGGSYARTSVAAAGWNAAGSGQSTNINAIQWLNMPAVTVAYIGVWDSPSGGNWIWGGALSVPEVVTAGATFQINGGNLAAALT